MSVKPGQAQFGLRRPRAAVEPVTSNSSAVVGSGARITPVGTRSRLSITDKSPSDTSYRNVGDPSATELFQELPEHREGSSVLAAACGFFRADDVGETCNRQRGSVDRDVDSIPT